MMWSGFPAIHRIKKLYYALLDELASIFSLVMLIWPGCYQISGMNVPLYAGAPAAAGTPT